MSLAEDKYRQNNLSMQQCLFVKYFLLAVWFLKGIFYERHTSVKEKCIPTLHSLKQRQEQPHSHLLIILVWLDIFAEIDHILLIFRNNGKLFLLYIFHL